MRQRASGRRRSTPRPLARRVDEHPVDASRAGDGSGAAVGDHREDAVEPEPACRAAAPGGCARDARRRRRPARASPTRSAIAVALPPGAAATSSDRLARLRVEERDHGLAGLVLRRGPTLRRRRGAAPGRRCRARSSTASGRGSPRLTSTPPAARARRRRASVSARRSGFDAQRDRRRLVADLEHRARVVGAEIGDEPLDDPVGVRQPHGQRVDVVAARPRPLRADARERAQHRVHVAAGAAGSDARRSRPRPRGRARPWTSWYAPSRSAARTGGSSASSGRSAAQPEEVVERALLRAACRTRGR